GPLPACPPFPPWPATPPSWKGPSVTSKHPPPASSIGAGRPPGPFTRPPWLTRRSPTTWPSGRGAATPTTPGWPACSPPCGGGAGPAGAPARRGPCGPAPALARAPAAVQRRYWGLEASGIARRLVRAWQLPRWLAVTISYLGLPAEPAQALGAEEDLFRVGQ